MFFDKKPPQSQAQKLINVVRMSLIEKEKIDNPGAMTIAVMELLKSSSDAENMKSFEGVEFTNEDIEKMKTIFNFDIVREKLDMAGIPEQKLQKILIGYLKELKQQQQNMPPQQQQNANQKNFQKQSEPQSSITIGTRKPPKPR